MIKNLLITGITGSLGKELLSYYDGLYTDTGEKAYNITGISLDQHKQAQLQQQYPHINLIRRDIGAVDVNDLTHLFKHHHILIHAAALKVVNRGNYNPDEVTRVNVNGSADVIKAWAAAHPYGTFPAVAVSSDKAVAALNHYGASKKMMESSWVESNYPWSPRGSVVRYGNVVTSKGSFLNVWQQAIKAGDPIKVVKQNATRFFMTMTDALALITQVVDYLSHNGTNGIFVPMDLKAFQVQAVARAVLDTEVTHAYPISWVDIGPYEKLHESLLAEGEGVKRVRPYKFGRVYSPHWPDDNAETRHYLSNLAPRLTGEQVLELAGWEA